MAQHPLSVELQKFITRYIHSVEQLETLCLLAESPSQEWGAAEVFQRIQSSRESVAGNLRYFAKEKLVVENAGGNYRYGPEAPGAPLLVAELIKNYRERRVTVIDAIYRAPMDPIQNFADAFRIRKDRP